MVTDAWQPKTMANTGSCMMRVQRTVLHRFLQQATAEGFSAAMMREDDETQVIWLKDRNLPDAIAASMELLEGIEETRTWHKASALFVHQKDGRISFGLRVPPQHKDRVRALSGKDLRTLYVLSGALPGWTSADVADILQHLKWIATPERQMGQRSWLVRADSPPHKWRHLAQAGYMRLTLEIKTFKKKEAEKPAATPTAVGQRSWASVCKGPVKLD
eukprot:2508219-Amphidinium_carterae.1